MKALKILLIVLLVIGLLLGAVIYFAFTQFDGFIERTIEQTGSEVLQTEVTVESTHFELTKGRGEITGLRIKNPEGFAEPLFFKLDKIFLQIEPASLARDVYVIDELTVEGAELTLEHKGMRDTNLQKILDSLRAHGSGSSSGDSSAQNAGDGPRFAVQKLNFINSKLHLVSPQIDNQTFALNDIQQQNIGNETDGLSSRELAIAIARPLMDEAKRKYEEKVKTEAANKIKEALKKRFLQTK